MIVATIPMNKQARLAQQYLHFYIDAISVNMKNKRWTREYFDWFITWKVREGHVGIAFMDGPIPLTQRYTKQGLKDLLRNKKYKVQNVFVKITIEGGSLIVKLKDFERPNIESVSDKYNRSTRQTKELFQLCDFNYERLISLENKIKQKCIFRCPSTRKEIDNILEL